MPKLGGITQSVSERLHRSQGELNRFFEKQSPPLQAFWEKTRKWSDQKAANMNERLGVSRNDWLEITRIAIRLLLPFLAALFTIAVFPPKVAHKIVFPTAVCVLFLSAFYGIKEEAPRQGSGAFSLERVPSPSFIDISGKEEEES